MAKMKYQDVRFAKRSLAIIADAESILREYSEQGYRITLRQLYYQFVARDLFPSEWADKATGSTNNQKSYDKLGETISNARLAGLIDWNSLDDITRSLESNPHWTSPTEIVESCASQFRFDLWRDQQYRIEVWVEKDAMKGVIGRPCKDLDVPYFSCRGYTSQTSMWEASQRLLHHVNCGQQIAIFHLGDHDPSGIDMSRDIHDRLKMFMGVKFIDVQFERIALNMDQVEEHKPPENPAKVTDSRFEEYRRQYGDSSWELDALPPAFVDKLIRDKVAGYRDEKKFSRRLKEQKQARQQLNGVAERWADVVEFVKD